MKPSRIPQPSWKQRAAMGSAAACGAVAAAGTVALWQSVSSAVFGTALATPLGGVARGGGAVAVAICALVAEALAYEAVRPVLRIRQPPGDRSKAAALHGTPEPAFDGPAPSRRYSKEETLWT